MLVADPTDHGDLEAPATRALEFVAVEERDELIVILGSCQGADVSNERIGITNRFSAVRRQAISSERIRVDSGEQIEAGDVVRNRRHQLRGTSWCGAMIRLRQPSFPGTHRQHRPTGRTRARSGKPGNKLLSMNAGNVMQITRHDKSYIVELEDGSRWRVWPADIAATLQWLPTTEFEVLAIDDEFCSHALINQTYGSQVGVIKAEADWPAERARRHLKHGRDHKTEILRK